MIITRSNPHATTYDLYGDPSRLAEFRLFSLNECSMACKGCFYNRVANDFQDFPLALKLAQELIDNDYTLETVYLLPTEFFENEDNHGLFNQPHFVSLLRLFNYTGIAATLESPIDHRFFETFFRHVNKGKIELQVNLSLKRIEQTDYIDTLRRRIAELKHCYGERIVINLAINTGFRLSAGELEAVNNLLRTYSEDGIVELNFTFLFNPDVKEHRQKQMLQTAIEQVEWFKRKYREEEKDVAVYNLRTFHNKPSFSFIGNPGVIYANPILPFDEYVFVKSDHYRLNEPTFTAFQQVVAQSDQTNLPHLNKCYDCPTLTHCMGKHYFSIAHHYDLGCFEDKVYDPSQHRRVLPITELRS